MKAHPSRRSRKLRNAGDLLLAVAMKSRIESTRSQVNTRGQASAFNSSTPIDLPAPNATFLVEASVS
jgi:hypothetical protein